MTTDTDLDALLAELDARGVILAAHGDKLRIDAPRGALTPGLRARLAASKQALLAYLAPEPAAPPEIVRIPLGFGPWAPEHQGADLHDHLAAAGLRVVGGTPRYGGAACRPMLYLAESADKESKA